jgi:hypothetical protein
MLPGAHPTQLSFAGGLPTDVSRFPVVIVELPAMFTLEQIDTHIANLLRLAQTCGPFAVIGNLRETSPFTTTPRHRSRFAQGTDLLASHKALVAEGVVVPSSVVRGLFTAYYWLRKNKGHPTRCFATLDQAIEWCEEALQAAGYLE